MRLMLAVSVIVFAIGLAGCNVNLLSDVLVFDLADEQVDEE